MPLAADAPLPTEAIDAKGEITLGLLDAIDADHTASQRTLANQLGIALGLTNAYLKRCIHKGWIKVRQTPANRYFYYVTPKGFAEKSRLTTGYLARSLTFYREARSQFEALFDGAAQRGHRRIVLAGAGELAEIAQLCALQYPIEIVGVLDPGGAREFRGLKVAAALADLDRFDLAIVTALKRPQRVYRDLCLALPSERVAAPALLKVAAANGVKSTKAGGS
ncbi:MAG: winged helix-turn-helix transcriptional regulator [Alphaproteobacteria bacterium]|nr:winged helix-turn-helix transcriptional regulator [Alphaproteobacteria bacterium]